MKLKLTDGKTDDNVRLRNCVMQNSVFYRTIIFAKLYLLQRASYVRTFYYRKKCTPGTHIFMHACIFCNKLYLLNAARFDGKIIGRDKNFTRFFVVAHTRKFRDTDNSCGTFPYIFILSFHRDILCTLHIAYFHCYIALRSNARSFDCSINDNKDMTALVKRISCPCYSGSARSEISQRRDVYGVTIAKITEEVWAD